jgi:hypothetical protein
MVESLASQRLTFNSGKTKVLAPDELVAHFWLDENDQLDPIEAAQKADPSDLRVDDVELLWSQVQVKPKTGHWDKVVKRLLRMAAIAKTDIVTFKNCKSLLIDCPLLAERLFEYLLARSRFEEYLRLFRWYLKSENSLYEDVESSWFESLLISSPPKEMWPAFRKIAVEFIRGRKLGTTRTVPRIGAAMLLYWLWDGRSGGILRSILESTSVTDGPTRRTMASILCARIPEHLPRWLLLAARHSSPHVSSLIEWLTKLKDGTLPTVPNPLVFVKRPSVLNRFVYDARAWLRACRESNLESVDESRLLCWA